MTKDEYIELLKAIGHFRAAAIRKADGRYYVECECGYRSATRVALAQAIEAIEHHRRVVIRDTRANGAAIPRSVAAGR